MFDEAFYFLLDALSINTGAGDVLGMQALACE